MKEERKQEQMWPIHGQSKAKRISWGAPQNHMSWSYMKMLREGNRTCKVYECNPYVEVYQFRDNLYGLFNQNNDGAGDVWMYVLIGPEKALVIDTAGGLGNQKGLVDELVGGKPYIVVNTHLGPDHSFGNIQYEKVYCHEYEVLNIKERVKPGMFDYLFDENGNNIWLEFDKADLPEYQDYELIGVPDGYIFNLGEDYDVELVWTAGHAAGHAMYLDRKGRVLFAGDDVCSDVIGCGSGPRKGMHYQQYTNIQSYRDRLEMLCKRLDEFDYIFPGHFMVELENTLLLDILETLNAIVREPENCDYKLESVSGMGGERKTRYHKCVKGFGTVAYSLEGVYRPNNWNE